MVVIRLARGGAKRAPFFHVVVTDSRNRRDGRYIERLGYYNPVARSNAKRLELNLDRIDYWLHTGAQPSERVGKLIKLFRDDPEAAAAPKPIKVHDNKPKLAAVEAPAEGEASPEGASEGGAAEESTS